MLAFLRVIKLPIFATLYLHLFAMSGYLSLLAWIFRDGMGPDAPPTSTGAEACLRFVLCFADLLAQSPVSQFWILATVLAHVFYYFFEQQPTAPRQSQDTPGISDPVTTENGPARIRTENQGIMRPLL